MEKITDEIYLRPLQPDEENYWREVFFDSVIHHYSEIGMPEEQLNNFLETQFQAQNKDYRENYPKASNRVILYKGEPVGRVIYTTEHHDLNIMDMAILSKFRGHGIGTEILQWFFGQSRASDLPIRFYVEKFNPAQRLYERLGFKVKADVHTHFEMEWRAADQV